MHAVQAAAPGTEIIKLNCSQLFASSLISLLRTMRIALFLVHDEITHLIIMPYIFFPAMCHTGGREQLKLTRVAGTCISFRSI